MSSSPVMSGVISSDGPAAVLRAVELRATSGVLRYETPSGEVLEFALRRGRPTDDAASGDALERFLRLDGGRFEVVQRLPALPVSRGDDEAREGRLGVHGVLDLLRYCDEAGLTGALFVTSADHHADFLYDAGELVAVRVFGEGETADVQQALGWEDGGFRIEAWASMPALPEPSAGRPDARTEVVGSSPVDRETEELLKVVEVTLSSLLDERAAPLPEPAPKRAETRPPRTDATVRVIYLGAPGTARRTKTPPPLPRPELERGTPPPPVRPELERAKTEPSAVRSDPTLQTYEPPMTPAPEPPAPRPPTVSYFREAGALASLVLALSALSFLAAIAYPFVLE